jgi:hypothetical protein
VRDRACPWHRTPPVSSACPSHPPNT